MQRKKRVKNCWTFEMDGTYDRQAAWTWTGSGQSVSKWSAAADQVVSFCRLLDAGHVLRWTTLTYVDVTQRVALRDAGQAADNEITDQPK